MTHDPQQRDEGERETLAKIIYRARQWAGDEHAADLFAGTILAAGFTRPREQQGETEFAGALETIARLTSERDEARAHLEVEREYNRKLSEAASNRMAERDHALRACDRVEAERDALAAKLAEALDTIADVLGCDNGVTPDDIAAAVQEWGDEDDKRVIAAESRAQAAEAEAKRLTDEHWAVLGLVIESQSDCAFPLVDIVKAALDKAEARANALAAALESIYAAAVIVIKSADAYAHDKYRMPREPVNALQRRCYDVRAALAANADTTAGEKL